MMKPLIQFTFFLAALAASSVVRADAQSDATAKAVAPYVDELTAVVVHVDLSRIVVGPLAETLNRLMPDAKEEIAQSQAEATKRLDQFLKAGGKDFYITVSVADLGPLPRVLAIVPLAATADEKAVRAALDVPAAAGRRVGDALVLRLPLTDKRPFEIQASPRPELTAAFQAAGDGTAQAVLIPPPHIRRVIEELMPQLPKETGNGPSTVLTHGISWAAVAVDLPPRPALHAVIKSRDAQAAEALCGKWVEVLKLAGQQEEVRRAVPQLDQLTGLLTPKVEGDRLVFALDNKTAAIDTLVTAVETAIGRARDAARRTLSMNNVKQIGLGMLNYECTFNNHFPAAASYSPDGKPLLSWRICILPFIDENRLFKQFHLNEPWDSPHNKTLIEKMPTVFHSPKSKAEKGKTNYLVPVGNGALYASSREEADLRDIKDGASNTIMVVEVDDQHAVTWTKPDDLPFDPKDPKQGIGSMYEDGFIVGFCDGSVHFLKASIDVKTLAALFTRAGGEEIGQY